jgi:holo-[acyl-carrier protein] synthase
MRIGLYLATLEETPSADSSMYTEREREYCLRRRHPNPHLAGRFAAKKAVCVALDLDEDFPLDDIEVARERGKAPTILFHGSAHSIASRAGTRKAHVSISHSGDYAVALVVLE